jgi:hypothetical protein
MIRGGLATDDEPGRPDRWSTAVAPEARPGAAILSAMAPRAAFGENLSRSGGAPRAERAQGARS